MPSPNKNGLPPKIVSTPHDAQANYPKRVWWTHVPPKVPHNETPLYPKDEQQANPEPNEHEKEG